MIVYSEFVCMEGGKEEREKCEEERKRKRKRGEKKEGRKKNRLHDKLNS